MPDKDSEIEELRRRLAALEGGTQEARPRQAPMAKPPKVVAGCLAVAAFAVVFLIILVATGNHSDSTISAANGPAAAVPSAQSSDLVLPPSSSRWTYSDLYDPMSDARGRRACTTSVNQVQLDFPYKPVTADLCVRRKRREGLDVYVRLNGDGQILCTAYDGCTVHVRFDSKSSRPNSAVGAEDNSTNVIFLEGARSLVTSLKSADVTRVQLNFYQAGSQTLEFPTKGLEWSTPATKKK